MKIRSGFVSNSSSSSFVCIGIPIEPWTNDQKRDFAIKMGYITEGELDNSKYSEGVIYNLLQEVYTENEEQAGYGRALLGYCETGYDEGAWEVKESIIDIINKIKEIADKLGIKYKDKDIILRSGEYCC